MSESQYSSNANTYRYSNKRIVTGTSTPTDSLKNPKVMDENSQAMFGSELVKHAKQSGLRPIYGETRTHERIKSGTVSFTWKPINREDKNGTYEVCKGHCLVPPRNRINDVQRSLQENVPRQTRQYLPNPSQSSLSNELRPKKVPTAKEEEDAYQYCTNKETTENPCESQQILLRQQKHRHSPERGWVNFGSSQDEFDPFWTALSKKDDGRNSVLEDPSFRGEKVTVRLESQGDSDDYDDRIVQEIVHTAPNQEHDQETTTSCSLGELRHQMQDEINDHAIDIIISGNNEVKLDQPNKSERVVRKPCSWTQDPTPVFGANFHVLAERVNEKEVIAGCSRRVSERATNNMIIATKRENNSPLSACHEHINDKTTNDKFGIAFASRVRIPVKDAEGFNVVPEIGQFRRPKTSRPIDIDELDDESSSDDNDEHEEDNCGKSINYSALSVCQIKVNDKNTNNKFGTVVPTRSHLNRFDPGSIGGKVVKATVNRPTCDTKSLTSVSAIGKVRRPKSAGPIDLDEIDCEMSSYYHDDDDGESINYERKNEACVSLPMSPVRVTCNVSPLTITCKDEDSSFPLKINVANGTIRSISTIRTFGNESCADSNSSTLERIDNVLVSNRLPLVPRPKFSSGHDRFRNKPSRNNPGFKAIESAKREMSKHTEDEISVVSTGTGSGSAVVYCDASFSSSGTQSVYVVKDESYLHALQAGALWQTLVGQHVRFPDFWWGGNRLGEKMPQYSWYYIALHRLYRNTTLDAFVPDRWSPGRLILHIIIRDKSSGPVQDVAVGCYHPYARSIIKEQGKDCRLLWMAIRKRSGHTPRSTAVIDPILMSECSLLDVGMPSPLGKHRRMSNRYLRPIFGDLPPDETVILLEKDLVRKINASRRREVFSERTDITLLLLELYLTRTVEC